MRINLDIFNLRRRKAKKYLRMLEWRKFFAIIPRKIEEGDWRMFEVLYVRAEPKGDTYVNHGTEKTREFLHAKEQKDMTIDEMFKEDPKSIQYYGEKIKRELDKGTRNRFRIIYKTKNQMMADEL